MYDFMGDFEEYEPELSNSFDDFSVDNDETHVYDEEEFADEPLIEVFRWPLEDKKIKSELIARGYVKRDERPCIVSVVPEVGPAGEFIHMCAHVWGKTANGTRFVVLHKHDGYDFSAASAGPEYQRHGLYVYDIMDFSFLKYLSLYEDISSGALVALGKP